jgi:hypothetical protein
VRTGRFRPQWRSSYQPPSPVKFPLPTVGRHFSFEVIRRFGQESQVGKILVSKYRFEEYSTSASVSHGEQFTKGDRGSVELSPFRPRSYERGGAALFARMAKSRANFICLSHLDEALIQILSVVAVRAERANLVRRVIATTIPLRLTEHHWPFFHSTCNRVFKFGGDEVTFALILVSSDRLADGFALACAEKHTRTVTAVIRTLRLRRRETK